MNRNEQEYYKNIKRIADALEKIANKTTCNLLKNRVLKRIKKI